MEDGLTLDEIDVPQNKNFVDAAAMNVRYGHARFSAKIQTHINSRKSPTTNGRRKQDTYQ